jgi:hypothetical protein
MHSHHEEHEDHDEFRTKTGFVSFVPSWLISDSNLHRRLAKNEISLKRRPGSVTAINWPKSASPHAFVSFAV